MTAHEAVSQPRSSGTSSIADSIASLCAEFQATKEQLHELLRENSALRLELAETRAQLPTLPELDLARLRRRVAFYCHPDRGGDAGLMTVLNQLFDALEAETPAKPDRARARSTRHSDERRGGTSYRRAA